jgi:outer membrane protein assembly factor BamD
MTLRIASNTTGQCGRAISTFGRAAVLLGTLFLAGCIFGGRDDTFEVEPLRPAAEIYAEGLAAVESARWAQAVAAFEELDRHYPYSEIARDGLLLMTLAQYESRQYEEAIETAQRYLLLYPNHPDAAHVLFLEGEAFLRQVPDVTRDQDAAIGALAANQELVERFPNSEFADQARLNIIAIRDQLAGQEMLIGRYYLERREYVAAVNRFRGVVEGFQETRHVEEALYRLTEAYLAMGLVSEAQTAAAILGHNFPNSPWYQDAYNLLGAGGLQPNQNRTSWLSGLFGG